ncbi:uroporphyrinogen-III synthase [Alteromonas sp. a30]|nr:uroporphyrinogen-III synthase [Alteromonas sp. a30]
MTAHNVSCTGLPLMRLQPMENVENILLPALHALNNNDIILVTSTKAAEIAADILKAQQSCPDFSTLHCYAVGQSSASTLSELGHFKSPEIETSEGLLNLLSPVISSSKQFANSKKHHRPPKRVVILKGEGGRQTIKTTLQQVGCLVVECDLYRRQAITPEKTTSHWQQQSVDCIIATSGELMQNAFNSLPNDWLCDKHWIVVSDRMKAKAKDFGINKPIFVSRAANDAALLEAVRQFPEG